MLIAFFQNLLVSLLTYLDQEYIVNKSNLKPIRTTAYTAFEEFIFGNPIITTSIKEGLKGWVETERSTKYGFHHPIVEDILSLWFDREQHSYRSQIPLLINHLVAHGQYSNYEQHYASITRDYYTAESQRLSEEHQKDPQTFFRHVRYRIDEEEARSREVLPVDSWGLVRETVEKALWDGRLDWLANESTYSSKC
jgi:cullin-4